MIFFNKRFIRSKKIAEIKKEILEKKEPCSLEEAGFYEQIIEDHKTSRPIYAWGSFLLLQYYKDNFDGNKEILYRSIRYGEKIRDDFKEYSFYEDAMFILGNIYIFEIFDFKTASEVYQQLVEEKENTRWKSICMERIKLISKSISDKDDLKLYVYAEKYFEESKFADAEFYLNEIIKKNLKTEITASALYFLGDINYYKYNNLDSAMKYYSMAADFPNHSLAQSALYRVGEILRKIKHWEKAIQVYRDYINKFKVSPYKDDAYYYIGECYQNLGKLREAKNSFNLVLGDFPNSKWTDVIYHKVQDINKILKVLGC